MLNSDLAEFYQVETKYLNRTVRRNSERFPEDFSFQLIKQEIETLKSQNIVVEEDSAYLPLVFTSEGIAMLSSVLKSKRAIEVNIAIMRAFVSFRTNDERLNVLELKMDRQTTLVEDLLAHVRQPSSKQKHDFEVDQQLFSSFPTERYNQDLHEKVGRILAVTAQYFKLTVSTLKGQSRAATVALARQVAMHLIRTNLGLDYRAIGALFGGRDHTTVLHSCRKIEADTGTDQNLALAIVSIQRALKLN